MNKNYILSEFRSRSQAFFDEWNDTMKQEQIRIAALSLIENADKDFYATCMLLEMEAEPAYRYLMNDPFLSGKDLLVMSDYDVMISPKATRSLLTFGMARGNEFCAAVSKELRFMEEELHNKVIYEDDFLKIVLDDQLRSLIKRFSLN